MARRVRDVARVKVAFEPRLLRPGLPFRVYIPPDYDAARRWPAVLFLHGAGERGSDGLRPTTVGLGASLRRRSDPYPAIVAFPQCPCDDHWSGSARFMAMQTLAAVEEEFPISHTALTGISMGAAGAWLLAAEHPDRFARLAPICGWARIVDRSTIARSIGAIPTWVFHGSADPIVAVEESRGIVAALKQAGASIRYTELPGVGHNSWDPAYDDSELLDWLIES
jgi:predicted peptidase